jgi:trehalose/maltose transport system substrate-binding protein
MWGFVFQGRAYEGLTCNALEWVDSHGGGTIVGADGEISINNPRGRRGAGPGRQTWVGDIAPDGVLNYAEEEARGVFQSGNAVFMRNWPYAWSLAQSRTARCAARSA